MAEELKSVTPDRTSALFKMTISEKIKAAFASGEPRVLVDSNYGEILITRKARCYTAELMDTGMQMKRSANDPMEALIGLGPWIRQRMEMRRAI